MNLAGKRVLVTGGTGSLGQALVRRLLTGEMGAPAKVTVLSRDEAKQHYMRLAFQHVEILGLTAEESGLESFYRDLVRQGAAQS